MRKFRVNSLNVHDPARVMRLRVKFPDVLNVFSRSVSQCRNPELFYTFLTSRKEIKEAENRKMKYMCFYIVTLLNSVFANKYIFT